MVSRFFSEYYREDDVRMQLRTFFEYMLTNRDFLVLASRNNLFFMIEEVIIKNLTGFLDLRQITYTDEPKLEKYVTRFIAATISSLLSLWVASGFDESPERMSALAQRFLTGVSYGDHQA